MSNTNFALNSVWFANDTSGWAAGTSGTVLHTSDRGDTWLRQTTNSNDELKDVFFTADSIGWAVGANGVILHTSDGGKIWRLLRPTSFTLEGVSFADTSNGWAVGSGGLILGTHNGGKAWFIVQPAIGAPGALKAVWRRSLVLAYAAGDQGATPRTVPPPPDSIHWELRNAGGANQLESVCFPSDSTGFVVGYNGVGAVLRSDDGGKNWQSQTSNSQSRLNDVYFVDRQRGWAVGQNGTIIHTGTGGLP